jgi:diguanylate cyclase (GGDEF)-like protein
VEEIITASVGAMVQSAIRPYDTVGRFNRDLFGVVLVKRGDQDAYLWAEKLRKDVASRILAVGQRKSAVTISVGISDMSDHTGRDAIISGAHQALEKARSGEGNAVILY